MSAYRKSLKCRLSYIFIAVLLLTVCLASAFVRELNEHIDEITEFKCRQAAQEITVNAFNRLLLEYDMSGLYIVERDGSGRVISAQVDQAGANAITNRLTGYIENGLAALGEEGIKIPIGTLTGITLLSGKGAKIGLDVHQLGAVETKLDTAFESAGINQSRVRLTCTVSVSIRAILPDEYIDITDSRELILCDTVIVGTVPDGYFSPQYVR